MQRQEAVGGIVVASAVPQEGESGPSSLRWFDRDRG